MGFTSLLGDLASIAINTVILAAYIGIVAWNERELLGRVLNKIKRRG